MKLSVAYFAILREQRGLSAEDVETNASTPAALYDELRNRHAFTLEPRWLRVAVDDEFASMDQILREGDRVIFLPPVAGG